LGAPQTKPELQAAVSRLVKANQNPLCPHISCILIS
jgi:hypothetical protein